MSVRDALAGYVERGELPGAVALVARRGEVQVDAVGTTAVGGGDPMRRDTIFRVASMTKPVTAAATMILVEEGKLRLDEPVDRLLPELANRRVLKRVDGPLDDTVPAKRPITVRDLLTFRMGLGIVLAPPGAYPIQRAMEEQQVAPPLWPESVTRTPDEWMRGLGALPLAHQPGEGWMYNTGSDVLGVLVARASGRPLEELLRERIFEPLGMKDTAFSVPAAKRDRMASSYVVDARTRALELFDAPDGQWSRPPKFPAGGAGLVSTVDDFLAFGRMMLSKGALGRERILRQSTVEAMTTDQLTPEQRAAGRPILGAGAGWGLGVSVVVEPDRYSAAPGRYGWNGGLGTTWWVDPGAEMVAILLTQRAFETAELPPVCADFLAAAYRSPVATFESGLRRSFAP